MSCGCQAWALAIACAAMRGLAGVTQRCQRLSSQRDARSGQAHMPAASVERSSSRLKRRRRHAGGRRGGRLAGGWLPHAGRGGSPGLRGSMSRHDVDACIYRQWMRGPLGRHLGGRFATRGESLGDAWRLASDGHAPIPDRALGTSRRIDLRPLRSLVRPNVRWRAGLGLTSALSGRLLMCVFVEHALLLQTLTTQNGLYTRRHATPPRNAAALQGQGNTLALESGPRRRRCMPAPAAA